MNNTKQLKRYKYAVLALVLGLAFISYSTPVFAACDPAATGGAGFKTGGTANAPYCCGGPNDQVHVSINIGCKGAGNPLTDMLFAIIRFLSVGVGLIIIGSTVWAGLQYTLSRDDPSGVQKAKERLQNNFIALLVFIFATALLDFVIPGQFLQ